MTEESKVKLISNLEVIFESGWTKEQREAYETQFRIKQNDEAYEIDWPKHQYHARMQNPRRCIYCYDESIEDLS